MNAFRQGLAEAGYIVDKSVTIEFHAARNNPRNLPVLATDLVQRRPAVIVATGHPGSVFAAKAATSTVPIVFLTMWIR